MLKMMNKYYGKAIILLFISLNICLIAGRASEKKGSLITYGIYSESDIIKILKKAFSDWQGDKSEKLIFITADGQIFRFGNNDPNGISISLGNVVRTLARKGQHLGTVTNIFHNHKWEQAFTSTDTILETTLRKLGFVGEFQLFYPETCRIKTSDKAQSSLPSPR